MTRTGRRRILAGALSIAICALSACTIEQPEPGKKYVALGDSYVAGGGIDDTSTPCLRSDKNYPSLLAKSLNISSFADVSCGGATTDDVMEKGIHTGVSLPAQTDALSKSTELVTIGIGGNDENATATLFSTCFLPSTNRAEDCRTTVARFPQALAKIEPRITKALQKVKKKAPRAQVLLVGYLRILPAAGTCPSIPIQPPELAMAASAESWLDSTLQRAAKKAEVTYVPLRELSKGHDACAGDASWVNGIKAAPGDGAQLHPRAAGMEAVAKELRTYVKQS